MAEQGFSPVLLLLWVLLFNFNMGVIHGTADSQDVSALNVMFSSMNSPGQLTGWQANGGDPCSGSWKGVTCSGSQVTEINLANLGLNGAMGYNLDNLKNLKTMDLSGNNLNGAIPYQLPPNLQRLNLAQNQLNGGVPYSISLMKNLNYLNLAHNQLQNQLVDMFGNLPNLNTLDLSFNSFTGNLPESFGYLTSLNSLYLQNNQFTGDINVLQDLPLQNLNVANNRFTGWIPGKLKNIQNLQSEGNSWSSGPAPPPPPYTPPPGRKSNPGSSNDSAGGGGKSGINGGGIAGIIIAFIVVGAVVAFFVIKKRRKGSFGTEKLTQDQPFSLLGANEVKDLKSVASSDPTTPKIVQREITIPAGAPMTLNPPPNDRHKPFNDDELQKRPAARRTHKAPKNVSVFSVADLQVSTGSFSVDNLIGEGSTGRIYKAQFSDGKVLAVKKIDSASLPNQDPENFIGVVSDVSQLNHSNITPLVGYCSEHGQCLLVYEYLKNGSLHDYLHLNDEFSKPLSWNTRVKIALGTARALEYLHEVCSPAVVHRNLKSTNILLDGELNPQLSDCGLADLIPTRTEGSNHNSGSGYGAPEVSMSGQYTHKSDVYSFGVVMLELLTGRMPFDSSRPRSEQSLVRWATPQLHDIDALAKMVDPALKELYPVKSLSRFADIVALCVQPEPEFRPPMSEVVQSLVTLVQRANMSKRTLQGSDSSNFRFLDDPDT